MGIKKSRDSTFTVVKSGFQVSKDGIRRAGKYADPMGEGKEEEQEQDPVQFLPRKLQKKWKKLPEAKKQFYKEQALRAIRRKAGKKGPAFSEELPGVAGREAIQETARLFVKEKTYRTHGWRRPKDKKIIGEGGLPGQTARKRTGTAAVADTKKQVPGKDISHGQETAGRIAAAGENSQSAVRSFGQPAMGSIGTAGKSAVPAASIPLQASITGAAAKKAAGMFAERIRFQNAAVENQRIRLQSKIDNVKESHQQMEKPADVLAYTAAVAATGLLAVAVMAVQAFAAVLSVFLLILIPLLVLAVLITTVIALLTSIFSAVDTTYAYGTGESIVAVAIGEIGYHEGSGNQTKYGEYTGTNGMSWCHAFVSWCANECGFVDMGIFPKTASCETGRQWFISHQEYQASDGTYEPQPGDIIYFDYDHVGVSHHVGIVEYTENGVVHTIEGNKNDQVMRAHYDLNYAGIMGYGKPTYPDTGVNEYGTASEFLAKCKDIADTIVNDGNWIYSNSGVKSSFSSARKAEVRKTNCALYVSFVMQKFGTLKEGQTFYSDISGKLTCSSTVRERLEEYYDIYHVGDNFSEKDIKPGDICLWTGHTNVYAGKDGQGKKIWYDFGRDQTADGQADSGPFVRGTRTGNIGWARMTIVLRLKDQDSYGSGKTITLPKGLGDVYSYMGWEMITYRGTRQYELRVQSGEPYDRNGFGVINGRYVIACTSTFGEIGDEVDFVLGNGKVIHAIIGEYKSFDDPDCNTWGHEYGHCVVEFCVNKGLWYGSGKSITRYHPEWANTTVVKAVNLQKNFFDD